VITSSEKQDNVPRERAVPAESVKPEMAPARPKAKKASKGKEGKKTDKEKEKKQRKKKK